MGDKDRLKGWKIDIRSYTAHIPLFTPGNRPVLKDGEQMVEQENIDVQDNLARMLFHVELQHGPEETFKAKDLADKIRLAEDYVLLDQLEMDRVLKSYKLLRSLPEHYIEFLRRIRDAEEVSLKEDCPV